MAKLDRMTATDFAFVLEPRAITREATTISFHASRSALDNLTDDLSLLAADSVAAELQVRLVGKRDVLIEGVVSANVTQSCVVSFEPVAASVEEPVRLRLVTPQRLEEIDDLEDELDGPTFDVLPDDGVPIGQIVRDSVALALDPHPRHADAHIGHVEDAPDVSPASPFAALATLKNGD